MVISKRTKPRKKKVLHVPAVKLPQGPFELSDDWQLHKTFLNKMVMPNRNAIRANRFHHTSH